MRVSRALLPALLIVALAAVPARAQNGCRRVVVFTLPGVSWEIVDELKPPNLLRLVDEGSTGAMSVRTNSSRTSYASGFVTLGAGTRTDGGTIAGGIGHLELPHPTELEGEDRESLASLIADVPVGGAPEIIAAAQTADYTSEPGALASALDLPVVAIGNSSTGKPPPAPRGQGYFVLLAAMDRTGTVDSATIGDEVDFARDLLLEDPTAPFGVRTDDSAIREYIGGALRPDCSVVFIDQGDLIRADTYGLQLADPAPAIMDDALIAADDLLGYVDSQLAGNDLLLVVSPTSPHWDSDVHLGVALAKGPGFAAGDTLRSASTRQDGFVTLVDVAPTILEFLGVERPPSMVGRPFRSVPADGDLLDHLVALDAESVFAHGTQAGISTAFVIFQIVVYAIAILLFKRREQRTEGEHRGSFLVWTGWAGLGIVAFPLSTYLATPLPAHEMGVPAFVGTLIAIDIIIVTAVSWSLKHPLDRYLAITGATLLLFVVDLVFFGALQLNAVWGNDPIVAGRFTGLGNLAFAILGSSSLMTGAVLVHRYPDRRWVAATVAGLFAITVIVDGAPSLGSDVGGILALVPALGITYLMLLGKRPNLRVVLIAALGALIVLGAFLALDLARPPEERTHLGRLVEDIQARGFDAFTEAAGRKIRTNIRVFRSTIWTYLVPAALGIIAWLLLRPSGRWRDLAVRYPKLRAGLIGGLLLGVLGFLVNDSGIVVPAMVLSFLAPMSLLLHLVMEHDHFARTSGEKP